MTADPVETFREQLTGRFGWRLDDDRRQELSALLRARAGHGVEEYLRRLDTASPQSAEVQAIAEALAVSETYFFRNPEHFAVMTELALPAARAAAGARPLRILSAGAASGEEAHSIAIEIIRHTPAALPVEITGWDVSPRAIAKARRNRYSKWALRALPADVRSAFFVQHHDGFAVRDDAARMVTFEERNLLEGPMSPPARPWDLVFFRNTSMYFTAAAASAIVQRLAQAMVPDAFLFLGHAETLRGLSDAFDLRHTHGTFYYVHKPDVAVEQRGIAFPLGPLAAAAPAAAGADGQGRARDDARELFGIDDSWFDAIGEASTRVAELTERRRPPRVTVAPGNAASAPLRGSSPPLRALALMADERYDDALAQLDEGELDLDRTLLRAVILTNLGRIEEARVMCERVLRFDAFHSGAHYLLALCEERAGHPVRAATHDETAIYLDRTFAMPHLHLGLMARRARRTDDARRHLSEARELLGHDDSARILLLGGGFGRQALLNLCAAELAALPK